MRARIRWEKKVKKWGKNTVAEQGGKTEKWYIDTVFEVTEGDQPYLGGLLLLLFLFGRTSVGMVEDLHISRAELPAAGQAQPGAM